MPKLSIITVNLNNLAGLQKTMQSVFEQTFTDYEYIIIDGGSTDGSKEYIEQHSDKLVYWVSEKDVGVYNAMNTGIKYAKGEYCNFLNSGDNFSASDVLDKIFKNISHEDLIYGNVIWDNGVTQKVGTYPSILSASYLWNYYLCHQAMVLKRALFKSFGLFDTDYVLLADWAFYTLCLIKYNINYKYLDMVFVNYDTNGITSKAESGEKMLQEKRRFMEANFPTLLVDLDKFTEIEKELRYIKSSPRLFRTYRAMKNIVSKFKR